MKNIGYSVRGLVDKLSGLPAYIAFLPRSANRNKYQEKVQSQGHVIHDGRIGQRVGKFSDK